MGSYHDPEEFGNIWIKEKRFESMMSQSERSRKYTGWSDAVQRTLVKNITI